MRRVLDSCMGGQLPGEDMDKWASASTRKLCSQAVNLNTPAARPGNGCPSCPQEAILAGGWTMGPVRDAAGGLMGRV